jgi:hypothetical protein
MNADQRSVFQITLELDAIEVNYNSQHVRFKSAKFTPFRKALIRGINTLSKYFHKYIHTRKFHVQISLDI